MSRSRPGPCARKTLHRRAGRGAPLAVAVEEPPNEPMKNWEERARFMDAFDACCLYELDPSDIALCARTCCWGRRSNGDQEYSVQHVRAWKSYTMDCVAPAAIRACCVAACLSSSTLCPMCSIGPPPRHSSPL